MRAVREKKKIWIQFHSKADQSICEQVFAPLEYGPGGGGAEGADRYWLWDQATLGLLPQQIIDLKILGDAPKRILVVEDETEVRQLYSNVLIRSGYQVDTADDGDAGWKQLHAVRHDPGSYDLLITDNCMPKLTGVELIRKLRTARMTLPVIMASGAPPANPELLELAALLPKPFSRDQLVQTVRGILGGENIPRGDQPAEKK